MTGRLQQGEAVFSNQVLSPFDRAPRGLSVMPGSPPRGCGTARRDRLKSAVVQPTDSRPHGTLQAGAFDAPVALNTGECLKVALASAGQFISSMIVPWYTGVSFVRIWLVIG